MLSNRREDELLNKLKSCLAPANNQNINIKDLRAIKNTYCNIKQDQAIPIPPQNIANQKIDTNVLKQPLRPANFNTAISSGQTSLKAYNLLSNNRNSVQLKHQAYNGKYDIPSSSEQANKTGKRYEYGVKEVSQPHHIYQEKPLMNRRFSHPHKELASHDNFTSEVEYRNIRDNKQQKSHKNYRQEVEQRKTFIDNPTIDSNRPKAIKKNLFIDVINAKEWPVHYQPIKQQAQRAINKQATQHQQVQRANPPSRSSKECIALAKLKRISELNEKINDRIRNIISVFQEHTT